MSNINQAPPVRPGPPPLAGSAHVPPRGIASVIHRVRVAGRDERALELFQALLSVLTFTNQDLATSIAAFKRLLVRKGLLTRASLRMPGFVWDAHNTRIADHPIGHCLALERKLGQERL